MIVLLFGPPGCGKGTQSALIASHLQIPAISTGEMFRNECRAGTRLGEAACSIVAGGGLVADKIVNGLVAGRLGEPDCARGFLLDGYPRTLPQARFFDQLLRSRGLPSPLAIHLEVPAQMIVARISARRHCPACGRIYNLLSKAPAREGFCDTDGASLLTRPDDQTGIVLERLKAYAKLTDPVIAHYSDCHRIDGSRSPQEVFREIRRLLAPAPRGAAKSRLPVRTSRLVPVRS